MKYKQVNMNPVDINPEGKFLVIAMLQSAVMMREMEKSKEDFIEFAKEIWESMLLTPSEELKEALVKCMVADLQRLKES